MRRSWSRELVQQLPGECGSVHEPDQQTKRKWLRDLTGPLAISVDG